VIPCAKKRFCVCRGTGFPPARDEPTPDGKPRFIRRGGVSVLDCCVGIFQLFLWCCGWPAMACFKVHD